MNDLRSGMNLGADDYLTKPFRSNDLLTAVKTRLEKYKMYSSQVFQTDISSNSKKMLEPDNYIFLPANDNYETIAINDIVCIISESVYSNVFTVNGKKTLVRTFKGMGRNFAFNNVYANS